jgi:hemolysin activation/secretion protein
VHDFYVTLLQQRTRFVAFSFVFLWAGILNAQNIPKPASVTPGGAQPQLERQPMPEVAPELVDVPPVARRPQEAQAGAKVTVLSFDLQLDGALTSAAGPELLQQANNILSSAVRNQPSEGMTIDQLQGAVDDVTDIFRAGGLALAWAYLPAQDIDTGKVIVKVLPGSLAKIEIEGNQRYKTDKIKAPLADLIGQPLNVKETEAAMLYVRDMPGVTPIAVLSKGDKPGTSNMTVQVDENPFTVGFSYDNYGSKLNGEDRGYAFLDWNNPLGIGDRLSVNILQTLSPSDNTYGGIKYDLPFGYKTTFSVYANVNDFEVKSSASNVGSEIEGDTYIYGVAGNWNIIRGRFFNASFRAAFDVKQADQKIDGTKTGEDDLTNLSAGFDVDGLDTLVFGLAGINSASLTFTHGLTDVMGSMDETGSRTLNNSNPASTRRLANGDYVGADFDKYNFNYQRLQRITKNNSLLLRGSYQWTDDSLLSIESMVVGGPYSVRAFPTSTEIIDRGGFASAEWITDIEGLFRLNFDRWTANVFLFYDYAGGNLVDDTDPLLAVDFDYEANVDLAGWGGGVEFGYTPDYGRFTLRLEGAKPTTTNYSDSTTLLIENGSEIDYDDNQYWARFGFQFN